MKFLFALCFFSLLLVETTFTHDRDSARHLISNVAHADYLRGAIADVPSAENLSLEIRFASSVQAGARTSILNDVFCDRSAAYIPRITSLMVKEAELTTTPNLTLLTNLEELDLSGNQLIEPPALRTLTQLQILNLSYNPFIRPPDLTGLTNLRELELAGNHLTEWPSFASTPNLEFLYLVNTQVAEWPRLNGLHNLQELYLALNPFSQQPSGDIFTDLNQLTRLDLTGTHLTTLPSLAGLTQLQELDVRSNNLTTWPALNDLPNLQELDIRGNPLTSWQNFASLTDAANLQVVIDLRGDNPLDAIVTEGELLNAQNLDLTRTSASPRLEISWPASANSQLTLNNVVRIFQLLRIHTNLELPRYANEWTRIFSTLPTHLIVLRQNRNTAPIASEHRYEFLTNIHEVDTLATEIATASFEITEDVVNRIREDIQSRFVHYLQLAPHMHGVERSIVIQWINEHELVRPAYPLFNTESLQAHEREIVEIESATSASYPVFITRHALSRLNNTNPFNSESITRVLNLIQSWNKWHTRHLAEIDFDHAISAPDHLQNEHFTAPQNLVTQFLAARNISPAAPFLLPHTTNGFVELHTLMHEIRSLSR